MRMEKILPHCVGKQKLRISILSLAFLPFDVLTISKQTSLGQKKKMSLQRKLWVEHN